MQVYQMIDAFCNEVANSWRKTQRVNLTYAMYAVFRRRSLTLSHLAQHFPMPEQSKVAEPKHGLWHRLKRLRRFLANERVDHEAVMKKLLHLGLSVSDEPGYRLSLLVDLTYMNPYSFLVVSVPKLGRALPVAWHTFRRDLKGEGGRSQNQIIDSLLAKVMHWLPASIQAVVVADREFARASLFRLLTHMGRDFVVRIDKETWILHRAYTGPLEQLPLQPGGPSYWFSHALYSQGEQVPLNLLAVWHQGYEEPWFLATSLDNQDEVFALYRQRMKIEHGFRDWKTHLRLKGTLLAQNVAYVKGLTLVLAMLYAFISYCGLHWTERRFWSRVACWGQPSFFKTAVDLLTAEDALALKSWPSIRAWLRDKLWPFRPLPKPYQLRYRRYRSSLPQTG